MPFEPGDLFCLPPGTAHSEHSENGYRNIYFTVSEFDLPAREPVIALKDTPSGDIGVLLGMLYKEFQLKRTRWRALTEQILATVYAYTMSLTARQQKSEYVEKLEEALVGNIANVNFKLNRCMAQFPVTTDYLRRTFKKETGKTPIQYLTALRIESAKRLFEKVYSDELSVKFVASQVGFEDPYYFSRVFKAVTGLSPLQWINSRLPLR
ncbi:helix-turn-helix domain-containing protein [Cohnella rhizosphaerae]|uniref:Helix-turn-helix transcriptional regulator n=1 Tax=Cohnella rhizosphaerae TaxID=1457232 RepID=A0A9X4L3G4_9BACL|nr:helix-turn-helix transcriptional regulator [Cohnella rhizosphaerae]MDG0812767.1 helix-turn-helix transcriptional regulator [Cohnella rhizosphaerae]